MSIRRILICEGDSQISKRYREVLEGNGYWVQESPDIAEAIRLATKQTFHLCLWGYQDSEGLNKLQSFRAERPGCAVVVLGSENSPSSIAVS